MKSKEVMIDLATVRALVAMQTKGAAEMARSAGIALPNLSRFLKSGQQTLLSKALRERLFQEMGLTASGWLRSGCHVWRTDNVEDVVTACKWVVPEAARVSISEIRSEHDRLDSSEALVQIYLLKWAVDGKPRRVLLQLQASEQLAVDARRPFMEESSIFDVKGESIDVIPVAPAEYEELAKTGGIGSRAFDDLFNRDSEITWGGVAKILPDLFPTAAEAFVTLQTYAASREIGRAKRRARGTKSE